MIPGYTGKNLDCIVIVQVQVIITLQKTYDVMLLQSGHREIADKKIRA